MAKLRACPGSRPLLDLANSNQVGVYQKRPFLIQNEQSIMANGLPWLSPIPLRLRLVLFSELHRSQKLFSKP